MVTREPSLTRWRGWSVRSGATFVVCLVLAAPAFAGASPFDRCRDLLAAEGGSRAAASCLHDAGAEAGRWDDAMRRLQRASSEDPDAGWFLHYRAEIVARTDSRTAAKHYGLAIDCFVRASDVEGEVTGRIRLSVVLFGIGDFAGARLHEGRALEVADGHGDPVLRAQARLQFAW